MTLTDWAFLSSVAFFVALGAAIHGYSVGSMNGLQNFVGFLEYFELGGENSSNSSQCTETSSITDDNLLILGTVVSVASLGAAIGNLLAGKPADWFSRKLTLVASGLIVVVGGAIQSAAVPSAPWMLIFGRVMAGLGYGVIWLAGPVYIAEISPKCIRGALTSLFGLTIALGIMTGYVTNLLLYDKLFGWRLSRILTCAFSIVYILGMIFMPKTPRWLMLKGRESETRKVLRRTSSKLSPQEIDAELKDIKESLESSNHKSFSHELRLIFQWTNMKRVILGAILHLYAAACGTAIFFYSEPLFCSLGVAPFVTALIIGGLGICSNIFTIGFIDKLGRKPLLVGGGLIMFVLAGSAASLVLIFRLEEQTNYVVGYIVMCLVCLFMLVYSCTWYIIPWVITSEIFSLDVRGLSAAICILTDWCTIYISTQTFPLVLASLQAFGSLYMISFIDLTAAAFCFLLLPETKGSSLEDMEKVFNRPCFVRKGPSSCSGCCDRGTGTKAKVITVDKTRVCGPSVGGETSSDTALDNQYMFDKLSVSSNRIKSVELEAQ